MIKQFLLKAKARIHHIAPSREAISTRVGGARGVLSACIAVVIYIGINSRVGTTQLMGFPIISRNTIRYFLPTREGRRCVYTGLQGAQAIIYETI